MNWQVGKEIRASIYKALSWGVASLKWHIKKSFCIHASKNINMVASQSLIHGEGALQFSAETLSIKTKKGAFFQSDEIELISSRLSYRGDLTVKAPVIMIQCDSFSMSNGASRLEISASGLTLFSPHSSVSGTVSVLKV